MRGHSITRLCEQLTVSLWQDNRPVVSNSNSLESANLYSKFMDGVDCNDQLQGYYNVRLKGRKFYKYNVLVFIVCGNYLTRT